MTRALVLLIFVGLAPLISPACAKAPPAPPTINIAPPVETKISAQMTLSASSDVNPDGSGRPSPVVVRVYQLKTDGAFSAADFFPLFDDDQKALGPELVSRDEFILAPAEQKSVDLTLSGETRYVGAVAAFRDIRNAQWRGVVPAPRKGLAVSIERARIVLTVAGD
jgi:type VI secretion system protein VasD